MRGLLSRLTLVSLFLLVTAAVSIGCGGEVDAPLPVGAPVVGATTPVPEAATLRKWLQGDWEVGLTSDYGNCRAHGT